MIACYTDVLSARPGDQVALHISGDTSSCVFEIARIGNERLVTLRSEDVPIEDQGVPEDADRNGCGWPVSARFEVGAEWPTGYYEILVTSDAGEQTRHFVCVKAASQRARAVLILATNTYQAYNWWGGRNTYCDAGAVMDGRMTMSVALDHGLGVVSALRPFAQGILHVAPDVPRTVNAGPREFGEPPVLPSRAFRIAHGLGPLDLSAGFVNKWEHVFVKWAEANGLDIDFVIDRDLDEDAAALEGYQAALVVGHSEYWSGNQRSVLDAFIDGGGNLAVFSGNTSYWKVRWDGDQMVSHKSKGLEAEPDRGADATGWWSHPAFGRPEAELLGLSFLFGGYHRLGMCVARGAGGYTIYDDGHWALEGADLFYGDLLAPSLPLLGYENDGCLIQFRPDGGLASIPLLGVPKNIEIIGIAPTAYAEDLSRGHEQILAREKLNQTAEFIYGEATEESMRRMLHGHAVMAAFTRGAGQVFNSGTTEWAHALGACDPHIERITLNVLRRFGALAH